MTQQTALLDILTAYRRLKVVAAACELGLFTRLAERPMRAADLAEQVGARRGPLEALLEDEWSNLDVKREARDALKRIQGP